MKFNSVRKTYSSAYQSIFLVIILQIFSSIVSNGQVNVALNKNIIGSSGSINLNRMVNGVRNDAVPGTTGSSYIPPSAEYIEIDLGADYFIDSIVIIPSTLNENSGRRFMIKTWPSNVPYPQSVVPSTYLTQSMFNRLIYTAHNTGGSLAFNVPDPTTVPQAEGVNLGPVYPIVDGVKMLNLMIGIHKARRVIIFNLQDGPLTFNEIEVYTTTKQPVRSFINGSFEDGNYVDLPIQYLSEGDMPGWSTTEAVGMWNEPEFQKIPYKGSVFEVWKGGTSFEGFLLADQGNYFVELNAHTSGMVVQEPVCLLPGEQFKWSFAHRGRLGIDQMALVINYQDVARFRNDKTQLGVHEVVPGSVLAGTTAALVSTKPNGWSLYEGTWTNPSASTSSVVTFGFRAVSSSTPDISVGNYIDNVSIVTASSVASFDGISSEGSENLSVANLPSIKLSGEVIAGSNIQLQITGGTAILGTHYNTSSGTNTITIPVTPGIYDESSNTSIDITPYIQVIPRSIPDNESDKTIIFQIGNPTGNILIPNAGSGFCQTVHATSTYKIIEASLLPVSLGKLTATSIGDHKVILKWNTSSEQNNSGFDIEHSKDGDNWSRIGFVASLSENGNSTHELNYLFTANNQPAGANYYRLKQLDRDGNFTYSIIVKAELLSKKVILSISPNPVLNELKLKVSNENEVNEITIHDISGKLVYRTNRFQSNINMNTYPSGLYILRVKHKNGHFDTERILKK